jgi:pyruvate,water dikinase
LTPPEEIETAQRERQFEAEQAFMQQVPAELRFFLHELIRLARTFTGLDDLEHFETTRLNVVARRAAVELAARLHAAGIVDDPDDLFFFQRADLERMIAGFPHVESDDYRTRIAEAREHYRRAQSKAPAWECGQAVESGHEHTAALRGIPGSPGTVTAPVFRVHSPADFGRFPPRSILVARTTNPAWTPLFYSAAGLIAESGGPLSHGAVTARELGLPAVMAVRDALATLTDGQVVTVDGLRGEVVLE